MIVDGLWDVYNQYHMGTPPRTSPSSTTISRAQQDEFAVASQNKAEAAQKAGKFKDEIVPVMIPQRKGDPVAFDSDEFIKHGATLECAGGLRPAFAKDGTVTAGNASGINDGAAAVLVMSAERAAQLGLKPLAQDQGIRVVRRRPDDHGHGSGAGVAALPGEGRLEAGGSRSDGDQRGLRRAGVRGQQGDGLGHEQDQRQRRRDRARPSDRRVRLPRSW